MINLGYFISAGQDVTELHVNDLDAALAYYDAEALAVCVEDRVRVAHILMDGDYVLIMQSIRK